MANGIGELLDELELTLSSGSCEEMVVQQSVGCVLVFRAVQT